MFFVDSVAQSVFDACMTDEQLIDEVWRAIGRHSAADRTARSYTWWAKLNAEPDKTLVMVSERIVRAALTEVLPDPELADWRKLMESIDRRAMMVRLDGVMMTLDAEERTADW
jgi:hypothetical protein